MKYDILLRRFLKHRHKGADIPDILNYVGQPVGTFTTAYPVSPTIGLYLFTGTDGTVVSGTTYYNGDSAFYDGVSTWTRVPAKSLANYYLKTETYSRSEAKNEFRETLPTNVITGEGTNTPTFLTISQQQGLTHTYVENDVIFPNKLAYKRRITGVVSSDNCFLRSSILFKDPKPTIFSFGFWVKDTDIESVYATSGSTGNMVFWWYDGAVIAQPSFTVRTVMAAIGNSQTATFNTANKASGTWTAKCIDKRDGYSFITVTFSNIVYSGSFVVTNPNIYFYFTHISALLYTKSIDFVNMTWLWDEEILSSDIHPDGLYVTQYPPRLINLQEQITTIANKVNNEKITVLRSGDSVYIRTALNDTQDLVQRVPIYVTTAYKNNPVSPGYADYVITNTVTDSVANYTGGTLIKTASDDACPVKLNGGYLGANHSFAGVRSVTVTGHDKTLADVGSEWTDGASKKWYIIRIFDANTIWFMSEYTKVGDIWTFVSSITGNLTHSANATHTGSMTLGASVASYQNVQVKNHIKKVMLDGITEVTTDGIYVCNDLDVIEQYDIIDPTSQLDYIKDPANIPYAIQPDFSTGDALVFFNIVYKYQGNGACVVFHSIRTYKEIDINYFGFTQNQSMYNSGSYTKLKTFIPKTLPITVGARTWNLGTTLEDFAAANAPTAQIDITRTYWEVADNPPNRHVQILADSSNNLYYGFAHGFCLTKGVGAIRNTLVDKAWFISTGRKSYPHGIDDKLGNVPANTMYCGVSYRQYFDSRSYANPTNVYYHKIAEEWFLYIDYHKTASFDTIQLPSDLVGKSVTVVEKSSNATLHTDVVMQNGVTVSITSGVSGYLVLKLT